MIHPQYIIGSYEYNYGLCLVNIPVFLNYWVEMCGFAGLATVPSRYSRLFFGQNTMASSSNGYNQLDQWLGMRSSKQLADKNSQNLFLQPR